MRSHSFSLRSHSFSGTAALVCGLVVTGTPSAAAPAGPAPAPAAVERSATCPSPDPPPGTGSRISPDDAAEIVRLHNEARREALQRYHPGLPLTALSWNPKLACDAQAWADDPASSAGGGLHHSSRPANDDEGENLLNAYPGPAQPLRALDPSVSYSWIAEKPAFDADDNAPIDIDAAGGTNYHAWGHYSQMVWMSADSATTEVGCGVKEGVPVAGSTGWILVCRYSPAGNVDGQRAVPPAGSG